MQSAHLDLGPDLARAAITKAGSLFWRLDGHVETTCAPALTCTVQIAEGLSFRAAREMACIDEAMPPRFRIKSGAQGSGPALKRFFSTQRYRIYAECIRAQDRPLVAKVDPVSAFLNDLLGT